MPLNIRKLPTVYPDEVKSTQNAGDHSGSDSETVTDVPKEPVQIERKSETVIVRTSEPREVKFDFPSILTLFGGPGVGKSTLIKYFVVTYKDKFDIVIVVSPSVIEGEYDWIPEKFRHVNLTDELMANIVKLLEDNQHLRLALILDDSQKRVQSYSKVFEDAVVRYRHLRLTIFCALQYAKRFSTTYRDISKYNIIFKQENGEAKKAIWNYCASELDYKNEFLPYIMSRPVDHKCVIAFRDKPRDEKFIDFLADDMSQVTNLDLKLPNIDLSSICSNNKPAIAKAITEKKISPKKEKKQKKKPKIEEESEEEEQVVKEGKQEQNVQYGEKYYNVIDNFLRKGCIVFEHIAVTRWQMPIQNLGYDICTDEECIPLMREILLKHLNVVHHLEEMTPEASLALTLGMLTWNRVMVNMGYSHDIPIQNAQTENNSSAETKTVTPTKNDPIITQPSSS